MKKYKIVLKGKNNIACSGVYTKRINAYKQCNERNNLAGYNKYKVVVVETNTRMSVKDKAKYLFDHHNEIYINTKREIINELNKRVLTDGDLYLVLFRITRKLNYLLPKSQQSKETLTINKIAARKFALARNCDKCPFSLKRKESDVFDTICMGVCRDAFIYGFKSAIKYRNKLDRSKNFLKHDS